ncbi:MAG: hypothetical protein QXE81_06270 [Desulfurococcaceae archaeon]
MVIICGGVDLSANERKTSGLSILKLNGNNQNIQLQYIGKFKEDRELIGIIKHNGVQAVAIDSPLTMPKLGSYYRKVDLKMIKMGYRVLPPAWPSMRRLTERGIRLATILNSMGITVIETHPSSCVKSSGCGTYEHLLQMLGILKIQRVSRDEKDALVSALLCLYYMLKNSIIIQDEDGSIALLPRIC